MHVLALQLDGILPVFYFLSPITSASMCSISVIKLPNYSHYTTATPTVGGGTLPVTFCCLDFGCSSFADDQFYFVLDTSFV